MTEQLVLSGYRFIKIIFRKTKMTQPLYETSIRKVYVGTWSPYLYVLSLDLSSGEIKMEKAINVGHSPSWITYNPARTHLYTVNETEKYHGEEKTGGILCYEINKQNGDLTFINSIKSRGVAPCHIIVDHANRHLGVANYNKNFELFRINCETGELLETPIQSIHNEGRGPHDRQDSSHAHQFALSPNQKYAFLMDLGLDTIFRYKYDAESGEMREQKALKQEPGSGPRHITWSPCGQYAYIINELSSTLVVCKYEYTTGDLKPIQTIEMLPKGVDAKKCCAGEIAATADGKFVYASNRGESDSIVIFKVNDGKLELVGHQETGKFPRHFTFEGEFMLVVNQNSDRVQVFRRNSDSGLLTFVSQVENIEKPTCVVTLW
jgi:6-phosphogluconolactonase